MAKKPVKKPVKKPATKKPVAARKSFAVVAAGTVVAALFSAAAGAVYAALHVAYAEIFGGGEATFWAPFAIASAACFPLALWGLKALKKEFDALRR